MKDAAASGLKRPLNWYRRPVDDPEMSTGGLGPLVSPNPVGERPTHEHAATSVVTRSHTARRRPTVKGRR